MADEAEVRVKINVSGDAAKATKAIADDTERAADAEAKYLKLVERKVQQLKEAARLQKDLQARGAVAGPAGPRTVQQRADDAAATIRQQADVRAELVKRGVLAGPAAPKTTADLANDAAARIRQQQAVRADLVARGVLAGPAAPKTFEQKVADAAARRDERAAIDARLNPKEAAPTPGFMERHAATLARVAAVGYAAKQVGSFGVRSGEIAADPYMSAGQRFQARLREVPLFGGAYQLGRDIGATQFGTAEARYQQAQVGIAQAGPRSQAFGRVLAARMGPGLDEVFAKQKTEGDAFGNFTSPRLASTKRDTALSEQIYREQSQLLPLRKQEVMTSKLRVVAEKKAVTLEEQRRFVQHDLETAREELARNTAERAKITAGDAPSSRMTKATTILGTFGGVTGQLAAIGLARMASSPDAKSRADIANNMKIDAEIRGRIGPLEQQNESLTGRSAAARQEAADARSAERLAKVGTARGEFENLQAREAKAQGQAQSLGSMGPLDLLAAQNAITSAKQLGYQNLSAEEKAAYRSVAPDAARKIEERIGEGRTKIFKDLVPDEFRDNLADARKRTDAAREKVAGLEDASVRTEFREGAVVLARVVKDLVTEINKQLREELSKIRVEAEQRNNEAR